MNRKPLDETEEITEGADYVNEPVRTVDKVAAPPDQRFLFFTQSLPPIAVCWLILLVVMGLRIHFTSVISEHDAKLKTENQNLKNQNQELKNQNQELKNQRNNLTEQIQIMETNWNELNVSRAQWSIDTYCPKDRDVRTCKACQKGWDHRKTNCYVYHDAEPPEQKTWEEARDNCRGKSSDLAVIHTEEEKSIINGYSVGATEKVGYWIGLRVEEGRWKWIDGTELRENSWIGDPTEGHCAANVNKDKWRSVMCDVKQRWICVQEALSV